MLQAGVDPVADSVEMDEDVGAFGVPDDEVVVGNRFVVGWRYSRSGRND